MSALRANDRLCLRSSSANTRIPRERRISSAPSSCAPCTAHPRTSSGKSIESISTTDPPYDIPKKYALCIPIASQNARTSSASLNTVCSKSSGPSIEGLDPCPGLSSVINVHPEGGVSIASKSLRDPMIPCTRRRYFDPLPRLVYGTAVFLSTGKLSTWIPDTAKGRSSFFCAVTIHLKLSKDFGAY